MLIRIETDDDKRLIPDAQIGSITKRGARFDIELVDGEVIRTFYEPMTSTTVAASGIELWQPVKHDDLATWSITPLCAFNVERGVVTGTATMTELIPLSGDSGECVKGVLVDRQRRLAWVLDSDSAWSGDLAAVLSEALGREVEVDHDAFAPLQMAA